MPHCLSGFWLEPSPFHLPSDKAKRYLLAGTLICAACWANFIVRAARHARFGRYKYYGCAYRSRRGDTVCTNRTLLPQTAIEAELLEILQQQLLTPVVLDRVLAAANAKLRAQAVAARPRVKELRKALAQVEREITNYRRAVARGDFRSLETALEAAEQRPAALQADSARLDGNPQQAVVQLTPAALDQHLQGLTEKLRSGVSGKVREVIERAVSRILVRTDGSLTIEAKPGGLLGVNGTIAQVDSREGWALIEPCTLSAGGRLWKLSTAW